MQPLHQRVGQRRQQQPELVGDEARATGSGAEQIELRLLDPVLDLAAPAVQMVIQLYRIALEVGDDEARVGALGAPYSSRVMTRRSWGQSSWPRT
jgi:hypothetical protein